MPGARQPGIDAMLLAGIPILSVGGVSDFGDTDRFVRDARMAWKVVQLTYVWYHHGDLFSHLLAYTSLLPIAVCVAVATLFWSRRDLQTFFLGCGCIVCEVVNVVLKRVIRQPRPIGTSLPQSSFNVCLLHCASSDSWR